MTTKKPIRYRADYLMKKNLSMPEHSSSVEETFCNALREHKHLWVRPKKHWLKSHKWIYNSYYLSEFIYHYIFSKEQKENTFPFVLPFGSFKIGNKYGSATSTTKHWTLITKTKAKPAWIVTDPTYKVLLLMHEDQEHGAIYAEFLRWDYSKGRIAKFYTKLPSKGVQEIANTIKEQRVCDAFLDFKYEILIHNNEIQTRLDKRKELVIHWV